MRYLILFFLSGLLYSCKSKNDIPKGILKPDKMQEVFWDYLRADIYASEFMNKDSTKSIAVENLKLQDKVFKIHHVTKEEFYDSYTWYSNHKELMKMVLDSMMAKTQRERPQTKAIVNPL